MTGLDCRFRFAETYGSHQFLNWWQQVSCCGTRNFLFVIHSQNFDRCHSLTSLHLPLAALGSLPSGHLHLNGFESGTDTKKEAVR